MTLTRLLCGVTVASALALGVVAGWPGPVPASAKGACRSTPRAVLRQNANDRKRADELLGDYRDYSYTPLVKTVTPEPTMTRHSTGFETVELRSPKGTVAVVGYFSISGTGGCGPIITSARVIPGRGAYVVKLMFSGRHGDPGKLKLTLFSDGPGLSSTRQRTSPAHRRRDRRRHDRAIAFFDNPARSPVDPLREDWTPGTGDSSGSLEEPVHPEAV